MFLYTFSDGLRRAGWAWGRMGAAPFVDCGAARGAGLNAGDAEIRKSGRGERVGKVEDCRLTGS